MLALMITILLPFASAGGVALILFLDRKMDGGDGSLSNPIPLRALLPAVLFTLVSCAVIVGFGVIYPLTPECRYWMEEGWRGSWQECPGNETWKMFVPPVILAMLVIGGVLVPRSTVKRLSGDGVFSSRRYLLTVVLAECSIVIPLALYAAIYLEHPFWWMSMMPVVQVWSWGRMLAMAVTTIMAERAWCSAHPGRRAFGRTVSALGLLLSYALLTIGGYNLIKSFMGEYVDCPCELDGLVGAGMLLIVLSLVAAAATLIITGVIGGICRVSELIRE